MLFGAYIFLIVTLNQTHNLSKLVSWKSCKTRIEDSKMIDVKLVIVKIKNLERDWKSYDKEHEAAFKRQEKETKQKRVFTRRIVF